LFIYLFIYFFLLNRKPAIRIPVPQQKRRDSPEQSPPNSSDHHQNFFRYSVISTRSSNFLTPKVGHRKYHDPNKNKVNSKIFL